MAEKSSEIPENIDEIFAAAVDIVHNLPKEGDFSGEDAEIRIFQVHFPFQTKKS